MARVFSTGFETGVYADEGDYISGGGINTTVVRTGGYSVSIGAGAAWATLDIAFPPGVLTEFFAKISFYNVGGESAPLFCTISDGGGLSLGVISLPSAGASAISISSNGLSDTSSRAFAAAMWHDLEMHFKEDNAAGEFTIKVDGITEASVTGDTLVTGSLGPRKFRFVSGTNAQFFLEDLVLNDTTTAYNNSWPGRVRLWPVRPDAAGDNTGLTASTGNNWDCVNEVPAVATDYVYGSVVDTYDLYNHTTTTLPTGYSISNLIVVNDAAMDSGSGNVAGVIKSDGTEATGSDHALSTTYHAYSDAFPVNPNTSAAWDQTDVNNIQGGPKVR